MIEKLRSGGSLLRVFCKAQRDKQLEIVTPARVDWWHVLYQNVMENYSFIILLDVRRISICQFHSEDTKRPNVNFGVVVAFA